MLCLGRERAALFRQPKPEHPLASRLPAVQVPAGSHGWAAPGRARARRASSLSKPAPLYGRGKACCSLHDERKKEKESITVNDLTLFKTHHSRNKGISEIFQLNELKMTPGALHK